MKKVAEFLNVGMKQDIFEQLKKWWHESQYAGSFNKYRFKKEDDENHFSIISMYTKTYYSISAYLPDDKDSNGYIGCIAIESGRHSDMTDGSFSKKTWLEILEDIFKETESLNKYGVGV